MKLRFKVDQAEALRRGVDCPKSIVTIEVTPSELTQEQRNLIADRMDGIDVYELELSHQGEVQRAHSFAGFIEHPTEGVVQEVKPQHITAVEPTFDALMEAILKNQKEVEAEQAKNREATSPADAGSKVVSVRSKWAAEGLDGKTVEFRIHVNCDGRPARAEGRGTFRARATHDGLIRIEIVVTEVKSPVEMIDHVYFCPQRAADLIQANDAGTSDFRLLEW